MDKVQTTPSIPLSLGHGAQFDDQVVPHPLNIGAYADAFPEFQGATVIYKAAENNVKDFFKPSLEILHL